MCVCVCVCACVCVRVCVCVLVMAVQWRASKWRVGEVAGGTQHTHNIRELPPHARSTRPCCTLIHVHPTKAYAYACCRSTPPPHGAEAGYWRCVCRAGVHSCRGCAWG